MLNNLKVFLMMAGLTALLGVVGSLISLGRTQV